MILISTFYKDNYNYGSDFTLTARFSLLYEKKGILNE